MFTEEVGGAPNGGAAGAVGAAAGSEHTGAAPAGSGLAEALGLAEQAVVALTGVEVHGEADRAVLDAAVNLDRLANQVAGQQLRLLEEIDRRGAYEHDGAVTTASWYRTRTRADHGAAGRQVKAAVRLRGLPALRAALAEGAVSLAHVTAVTQAVTPRRQAAFGACDDTLAGLARTARPREVRQAVAAVCEQVDADGADDPPGCGEADGPDERRRLSLQRTVDGLGDLTATLDPLAAEALVTLLDVWDTPDPPEAPREQCRTPGQRRADALDAGVRAALAAGATTGGVAGHITATIDLCELLGLTLPGDPASAKPPAGADFAGAASHEPCTDHTDHTDHALAGGDHTGTDHAGDALAALGAAAQAASDHAGAQAASDHAGAAGEHTAAAATSGGSGLRPPRLRFMGETTPAVIRRLAREAKITAILTMGPWRVSNVGRTMRTVPAWMRLALDVIHGHCRGPNCDRPIAWTQAHHEIPWADGGDTDLNATIPLCIAHHSLVTAGTWHVAYDPGTGTCTWTGPHGQVIRTRPP